MMMDVDFPYDNEIRICVPAEMKSTWKLRGNNNVIYRKKMKKRVYIKPLKKHNKVQKTDQKKTDQKKKIYCSICDCFIQHRIKKQHSRTNKHIKNLKLSC